MSQSAPSDADPLPGPSQPTDTLSTSDQDVPGEPPPSSVPLEPPLIPDHSPLSTEETTAEDAVGTDVSEVGTEPEAEGQLTECDQPVSLEPDAVEDDVEVCCFSLSLWPGNTTDTDTWIDA